MPVASLGQENCEWALLPCILQHGSDKLWVNPKSQSDESVDLFAQ
jgi:hypothetical protein